MSGQHTQGRLIARYEYLMPESHAGRKIGGASDKAKDFAEYAHIIATGGSKYHDAEANVRRLAACWNACEGVSTEGVELIADKGGMFQVGLNRVNAERELDAARALLQDLIDIEGPQPGTAAWADKVRAFLKGGAA